MPFTWHEQDVVLPLKEVVLPLNPLPLLSCCKTCRIHVGVPLSPGRAQLGVGVPVCGPHHIIHGTVSHTICA
jgi:hypothetical protein